MHIISFISYDSYHSYHVIHKVSFHVHELAAQHALAPAAEATSGGGALDTSQDSGELFYWISFRMFFGEGSSALRKVMARTYMYIYRPDMKILKVNL